MKQTRFVLLALTLCSLLCAAPAVAKTKTFELSTASPAKLETGIVLGKGETVKLEVSGNGKCGAGDDCPASNPLGSGQTCAGRSLGPLDPGPAPSLPYGSVDAQIGSGAPFTTGSSKTAGGKGELVLFYNDCAEYYGDNTGSFTVKATYSPCAADDEEEDSEDSEDRAARASRAERETKTCKLKVRISGIVLRRVCAEKGCDGLRVVPVAGQQVELIGKKRSYETQTNGSGEYRFRVKHGKYRVHLLGTTKKVEPDAHAVNGSDDVGGLDFTLCKMPDGYGGKVPGCDLVKVDGTATDYYDGPVSGPEITSDTDTATVKGGRFTIYATRGSGTLDEHRLLSEARPGDIEAVPVSTGADVNRDEVKFLPQIKYRLGLSKRGRMDFEAWNLPASTLGNAPSVEGADAPASYYFETIGTNRTSPSNLICTLRGGTTVAPPFPNPLPDGATLFEDFDYAAVAERIETSDGTPENPLPTYTSQYCEATYFGLIKDAAGNVLAKQAFPGKGIFKTLSPNE
ncbi:MAG TPA: hypothetical protein VGI73_14870 [Solirubrobacterales bacterium]|jgi:hypothetical protein